jgi:hypothetical protein
MNQPRDVIGASGFTVGVGRGGSAMAPMMAGLMFAARYSLPRVAVTMAIGSLVGAIVLLRLDLNGLARGRAAGLGQRLDQAALFVDEPAQRLAEDALRQQDVAQ